MKLLKLINNKTDPLVYIIILNYNGDNDLVECLDSLFKISYKNYKVLIVDNASTDSSIMIVHDKFPKIKIIKNQQNLGFAAGNNVGIKKALKNNPDYILLLNSDTIVNKNFLNEMVKLAEADPEIGIVVPKILYDKGNIIWEGWLKEIDFLRGRIYVNHERDSDVPAETKHATGCSMLIKKRVINKIGLLPEYYFMYFEDTDFSLKAKRAGFKLFYQPKAIIRHRFLRGTSDVAYYYWQRSRVPFVLNCAPNLFIKSAALIAIILRLTRHYVEYKIDVFLGKKYRRNKIIYKATLAGLMKDNKPINKI